MDSQLNWTRYRLAIFGDWKQKEVVWRTKLRKYWKKRLRGSWNYNIKKRSKMVWNPNIKNTKRVWNKYWAQWKMVWKHILWRCKVDLNAFNKNEPDGEEFNISSYKLSMITATIEIFHCYNWNLPLLTSDVQSEEFVQHLKLGLSIKVCAFPPPLLWV